MNVARKGLGRRASCHKCDTPEATVDNEAALDTRPKTRPKTRPGTRPGTRIALVGNPNVGKSTVFNALTGARQHVGNWPGKTVHVASGSWQTPAGPVEVIDLPGTYSLIPRSPDEALVRDLLVDRGISGRPDLVVVVIDAANLARNLYVLAQVLDTGVPVVVALTMLDIAQARGLEVDPNALSRCLNGLQVITVRPRSREWVGHLAEAIQVALAGPPPTPAALGEMIEPAVAELVTRLGTVPAIADRFSLRWLALDLLAGSSDIENGRVENTSITNSHAESSHAEGGRLGKDSKDSKDSSVSLPEAFTGLIGTLLPEVEGLRAQLIARLAADTGHCHDDATATAAATGGTSSVNPAPLPDDTDDLETALAGQRYAWVHQVVTVGVHRSQRDQLTVSDRIDRVLASGRLGLPVFLLVMWGVFVATTRLAAPLQEALAWLLDGPVSDTARGLLGATHLNDTWVAGLIIDGLISGVGQLLTFVPLMAIMFVLLTVLEDSGYMARAAFVADRFLRLLGLPGRAFLPLIVGFGCNVPAIAGTRILADSRHRRMASMLVPFVTCSARLTVYVLLANVFFGHRAGSVVFAMYVLSIVLVVLVGIVLRHTLLRNLPHEALVLELPPYRLPSARVVAAQTWRHLAGFLRTASGIIVVTVAAVWLLTAIPLGGTGGFGKTPVSDSLYGGMSRAVSPVFAPAGFDDWHATGALVTGFVAKEAVVSTFAQSYSAQEPTTARSSDALADHLRGTFEHASGGHATAAVLAFMVFLLAYIPCMATVAAQWAEIGGRWTLVSMGLQIAVAWSLATMTFQIGRLFL